ncbi:Pex19 protein family-domain-containing protein [Lanmaoa asiatica]|nr:Pex19 protein family-domain-containing protein [Lanmaoa asiatica]
MLAGQKARVDADDDDDLDDLDDAHLRSPDVLDQFSPQAKPTSPQPQATSASASTSGKQPEAQTDNLAAELAKEMESMFKQLGIESQANTGGPDEVAKQKQLAAAWEAILIDGTSGPSNAHTPTQASSPGPKEADFESRIRSTMNKLKESESGLKSSDSSANGGDELESLLSQLGSFSDPSGDGAEGEEQLQGLLETMMTQLMSKDVLYEPLKELYDKFPGYLAENSSTISAEDKKRFEAQISCIKRLMDEFDANTYRDEDEKAREKIVDLMGELQTHGSPPEKIMGPLPPGFNMGADGLPDMPEVMTTVRPRASATPSDADDAENNGGRRRPFRLLQPLRASRSPNVRSPTLPTKSTPPREVILTPRATPKPIKRKATSRLKRPATKVKSELPEVDLSRVRPSSPSDDPLLLSGTRSARSPPLRARFTPAFSSSPSDSKYIDPPVAFAARLSGRPVGALSSSPDTDVHALPVFDAPRAVEETSGAWSDSDDDGFNLTGEYTGKYKILKVPTKADPPTSGTKERMESWGRPVSPFPYSEIMERSLPLSDFAEDGSGREDILESMIPCEDLDMWDVATDPPPSDVEPSSPLSVSEDEFADLDDDFSLFDADAESTQVRPLVEPREVSGSDQTIMEEQEEEAQIDRELSVAVDDGPDVPLTFSKAHQSVNPTEDDSSDEEDDVEGEDIIKITSEDPKAAARAAAILRLHDYDCILAAEMKKRSGRPTKSTRKRRKTIENAGISKSYTECRSQQWKTVQGSEMSPGSRSLPLLELWRDAEDSVFLEHHSMSYCDAPFTLSPLKAMTTHPEPQFPPPSGEWNRDCWKCLDKCLVAERLAVGAARGLGTDLFANMGDISKDAVLDRFASQIGGESVLAGLGPDWTRDNLILRLDVLIKKQSRHAANTSMFVRQDSLGATELRYRGLLQEAMALSGTLEPCPTSASTASDTTVVSERHDARKMMLPDSMPYSEPGWQTSHSRDPIRTPSRTPDPRLPHPKEQVHLRHASLQQKSMIPVPIRPKRLVDLRHLSPTKGDRGGWRPTARRSSGCSVKDLVRQYESLDK